jgi:hypothetical protein
MARCPAHDDREPSLSIRSGNDGRVLLHCHPGCSPEEVVKAAGIRMSDLFPDAVLAPLFRAHSAWSCAGGPDYPRRHVSFPAGGLDCVG